MLDKDRKFLDLFLLNSCLFCLSLLISIKTIKIVRLLEYSTCRQRKPVQKIVLSYSVKRVLWITISLECVWSEIKSESDGEFLEDHGVVEQVTPTSEDDGTVNPLDCYQHFITEETISLMVLETNRYAEQYLLTHKLSKRSKTWISP